MLTGLRDRLERELSNTAPHTAKVKVTTPSNAVERRFSTWIGSLLTFEACRPAFALHHCLAMLVSMMRIPGLGGHMTP